MDAREKLVELVKRAITDWKHGDVSEMIADHLLSNGVTVQSGNDINAPSKWIPVTERLPEIGRKCLIANREIVVRGWLRPDGVWKTGVSSDEIWRKFSLHPPTHWMPLPEPPKDGAQKNACLERR